MSGDLRSLFGQVADLSPTERRTWFDQRGVPFDVRNEIESLLRFDQTAGHPLTDCISSVASEYVDSEPSLGSRCGAYQLVKLLGRGGMGAVYLAQRQDGEVRQQVAIKFVRNLAPRDRFLRERQLLASLNHSGIARLLDAGHTADGRPYMVMEYIEGKPLDVYCNGLDFRVKLEIFLKIAAALAYAHRNLIIHRDLKPSNILVTATGQPVLLDFGVARMLDELPAEGATAELILTPEYASPEQVRGTAYSTATDIYSLGAVLYHLVTGRPPHQRVLRSSATLEELICRSDPPAPSSIHPDLPRDLDFIIAKALRKEPEERYTAVDALAEDIRAFLESRPVHARAGNAWYRIRKFARRHWLPVAISSAALALLAAGVIEVAHERTIAQHRFLQLQDLANQVIHFDDDIKELSGATKARQKIVTISMAYLDGLGRDARGDLNLAGNLAYGYIQLAKVQGVPSYANLGQLPEAEASLAKAESYEQSILRARPNELVASSNAAEISELRMMVADTRHRNEEALAFARECASRLDALARIGASDPRIMQATVPFWINAANGFMNQHHFEEAIRLARQAVQLGTTYHQDADGQAAAFSLLANALRQHGDLDEALAAIAQSRRLAESFAYPTEYRRASVMYSTLWRQGQILGADPGVSLSRPDAAVEPFQGAFDMVDALAAKDRDDSLSRDRVGTAAQQLGDALRSTDPKRALEVYDRGIARQREVPNSVRARRTEARLLVHSSYPLRRLQRSAEAAGRITAAFRLLEQTRDYPVAQIRVGSEASDAVLALADQQGASGYPDQAAETCSELLQRIMAAKPAPETDLMDAAHLSHIYADLADLQRRAGNGEGAGATDSMRAALWRGWQTRRPGNAFIERQLQSTLK
jgi:serine/threonine protein kinase